MVWKEAEKYDPEWEEGSIESGLESIQIIKFVGRYINMVIISIPYA